MWHIGIDIGGTNIDCIAISDSGARFEMHKIRPLHLPVDQTALNFFDLVHKNIPDSKNQIKTVAIGWKHGRNKQRVIELTRAFAKKGIKAEIFWDAETAFTGALPENEGILVLSGTGSCVYGKTRRNKVISSGGWSPIFGDPGSAFAIGQQAIITSIRSLDGCNVKTKLAKEIPEYINMTFDDLIVMADADSSAAIPVIASVTKLVFKLADEGDAESVRIRTEAVDQLCERIISVVEQWKEPGLPVFSYAGRVMLSQPKFRQAIQSTLAKQNIKITWRDPAFRPPLGALLLAKPKLLPIIEKSSQSLDWHRTEDGG